ncbi:MAG: hypothetical protein H6907_21515 [Hyphomicrobiales bacterium]|nr:hypothetical protein [Hyphomicrobiales bacterium]
MIRSFFVVACICLFSVTANADDFRLTDLDVAGPVSAGKQYKVLVGIAGPVGKVSIREACFTWDAEGPYCFKGRTYSRGYRTKDGSRNIYAWLKTGNPGTYQLSCYVKYILDGEEKSSNKVSTNLNVY